MNALDQIPWQDLTHAYGSAADVPDLLRELRTAAPDLKGEDSPLWHLFGNIWHQGTVYEATAFAVPFLIELAVDRQTPDRVGILSLLAEIAKGTSHSDVHGNLLNKPDFERRLSQERLWVRNAHDAVAAGFTQFVELTKEPGDLACAAAHVLAQLPKQRPEQPAEVAACLCRLMQAETRPANRAGLLLLFGTTGDASSPTLAALSAALQGVAAERHAAAYSFVRLNVRPLPGGACEAIMEAITAEDLEASVQDLPWDATSPLDPAVLFGYLDESHREQVIERMVASLELRQATSQAVHTLVNLLFPIAVGGRTPPVTADGLTAAQLRVVRALYASMQRGEWLFYGHFPCWGLPDSRREWRELASGQK